MNPEDPLFAEYRKTIPTKMKKLQEDVAQFKMARSLDTLKQLRIDVHKLAGSAGTYGFAEASKLCITLDQELQNKINAFSASDFADEWFKRLDRFLIDLQKKLTTPNQ